jgi:hypothetical protein
MLIGEILAGRARLERNGRVVDGDDIKKEGAFCPEADLRNPVPMPRTMKIKTYCAATNCWLLVVIHFQR